MKKFKDFLNSKGFYIALGTGILAFAGLMIMYNYKSTKESLLNEQAIDLNQPVEKEDDISEADNADLSLADEDTADDVNQENGSAPVNSDSAIADIEENNEITEAEQESAGEIATETDGTADDINDESDVAVISDAAEAEQTTGIVAGLEYDGEQSLVWPLAGNVILPYSMETTVYFQTLDVYKCNPGMMIAGEEGASVFAAYEGVVTSIEDTREFGTVVRVNMGNGYEAIYGQLMNVRVSTGDTVSIAQTIAEVGPVSSYYSEEGTNLYFAITKDGEPVNPLTLIQ